MKHLKKILVAVVVIITLVILALYIWMRGTLPPVSGEITVSGLHGEVSIERNRWGVPLIQAGNDQDLFFAIGFLHASDRLFQMDLTRRLSTGRLSEIFGPRTLELDKYHKDLLIEEAIQKTMGTLEGHELEILEHYCAGVNAFIDNHRLTPEFYMLGYRPRPWKIEDILSIFKRMEIILAGSGSELYNWKLARILGKDKARELVSGTFGETIIDADEYEEWYQNPTLRTALRHELAVANHRVGSNNWVVSGRLTETGAPLLANDLHLPKVFPSYFYQVFAKGPTLELSGNTIPGIPLIVVGRTGFAGWGVTNVGTDVIDYITLETNPDRPDQYRWEGGWRDFSVLEKTIEVKGEEPVLHSIRMSAAGPVFEEDGVLLAKHSLMDYPATVFEAFYGMNTAVNLDGFLRALKKFSSPAQNVVFADIEGNIGYFPTGRIPARKTGDGQFPQAATENIWTGFIPEEEKPWLLNPAKGFVVTANNPVIPEARLPIFAKTWFPSFRADRIQALLQKKGKLTLQNMMDIQTDTGLMNAEFLLSQLQHFTPRDGGAAWVFKQLQDWDKTARTGLPPYLFYLFESRLAKNIFAVHIEEKKDLPVISSRWIYHVLGYPEGNRSEAQLSCWLDNPDTADREDLFTAAEKTLIEVHRIYSDNKKKDTLSWERLHTLYYNHPLGSVWLTRWLLNRGPYFMPGGRNCIATASFRGESSFDISHLSTFRMVLDFSDFSRSLMVNSSGQSGHFLSRHYDDQIDLFVKLKYRKMESFKGEQKILKLVPPTPGQ